MNRRERFLAICNFEPVDYVPLMRFQGFVGGAPGGWLELTGAPSAERARAMSLFPPASSATSLTAYLGIDAPELIPIQVGMWPTFEYKLLDLPEEVIPAEWLNDARLATGASGALITLTPTAGVEEEADKPETTATATP